MKRKANAQPVRAKPASRSTSRAGNERAALVHALTYRMLQLRAAAERERSPARQLALYREMRGVESALRSAANGGNAMNVNAR